MYAVAKMKNQKSYEYDAELQQFRKDQKEQRKGRKAQRDAKHNYQEGDE